MFVLEFQESGQEELQLAFQLVGLELTNWHHEFELLAPESTFTIHRVFDQEGPGWLKLTPNYEAWKSVHYPGKTILRRTDALYLSFETENPGNVTRIEALSAEFGSSIDYGIYHQTTRPIINITIQDDERFLSIVYTAKTERLRDLGFQVE